MRHRTVYTEGFVEQALQKVYNRGERSVASVAEQLGINVWTLRGWMKGRRRANTPNTGTRPVVAPARAERNSVERMQLLLDSHGLDEQALGAFCREHGLFAHQLEQWRKEFESAVAEPQPARSEWRELKQSKVQLERELRRKDKALAEAAALLVLRKKFNALWEDAGE